MPTIYVLYVFCLCHLFVIFCIYIYENYVKVLHFLRPTHIQRHGVTVGVTEVG